jgi:hypothetical protein
VVRTTAGFNGHQARGEVGKVFQHLGALDLHVNNFTRTHVHGVHLEHVLGDVQTDHLLAVHGADDLSGVHSCITIHGGSSVVE